MRSLISIMIIQKMETGDGEMIKDEAITFFSKLYARDGLERPIIENLFSCCMDEEEVSSLESVFSKDEVKEAVFSMDKDKSLGLDGFSSLFYQECWVVVKYLMEVFNEFYDSCTINKSTNATFIVLVPKKEDVCDFFDFRPISLMSSLYKIIVKVLSMRIRKLMGGLVSTFQGAFVNVITNNIIDNELVDGKRRCKEQGLVCKNDLEKAYDKVDWDSL